MTRLLNSQVRVLTKTPKGPEVSPSDVFSYNAAFTNPLFRIKINNIQLKETQEENAKTNEQVGPDTVMAVHASIHEFAAKGCNRLGDNPHIVCSCYKPHEQATEGLMGSWWSVPLLQVVQERQHAIDAAIVRVMKMRKSLHHKLLVQQVMTQLRFQLTNADLKKRIDNLIEREFLERSSTDSQVYNYLA